VLTRPFATAGQMRLRTDYSLGNLLLDGEGRLTGLVDWVAGRGDRWFALVQLRFELSRASVGPSAFDVEQDALDRLDEVCAERQSSRVGVRYRTRPRTVISVSTR
jgi:aminoglycoside phosphotransferase (APT) family kinase protein